MLDIYTHIHKKEGTIFVRLFVLIRNKTYTKCNCYSRISSEDKENEVRFLAHAFDMKANHCKTDTQ